jgi:hypothetical protein
LIELASRVPIATASLASLILAAGACGGRTVAKDPQVPIPWGFQEVGADGRSLELTVVFGGCQHNPRATALETAHAIRLRVTVEAPPPSAHAICLSMALFRELRVPLRQPVGGRPISGAKEERGGNVVATIRAHGPLAPRLTGLYPGDALRFARSLGFATSIVQEASSATAAEVIRQDPAAGQRTFAPRARTKDVLRRRRRMVLTTGAARSG